MTRMIWCIMILAVYNLCFYGSSIMAEAGVFYIAPDGADTNPGSIDKPVATLVRAQQLVREQIQSDPTEPVRVVLRGGRYQLTSPLVFAAEDSGTTLAGVTYAAYPGEVPRLSGGRIITGWQKKNNDLWEASIPAVAAGQWSFRQLYADQKRLDRGRYPTDGLLTIAGVSDDVKTLAFEQPLPDDIEIGDVELIVIQNWSIARALILSATDHEVTCATPLGWVGHSATTASKGKPAYLENHPQFITQPEQWYLNRKDGRLILKMAPGEKPDQKKIVAPLLETLLIVAGTPETPVRNIKFEGLVFEHAAWQLPADGYGGIQAGYNNIACIPDELPEKAMPVAVKLKYAEDCLFENCRFVHIGPSAVGFSAGSRRNRLVGCEIGDVGGNGIHVGWPDEPIAVLDQDWENPADVPVDNEICQCYVHHCAAENYGCVGIFAAFSANTRIHHNHVCEMPYTGISIGYRWNSTPTSQQHCLVAYNQIHDVMTKLADGGGIYTLGLQPGTTLRGNWIYNVYRSAYAHGGAPNNGIFFDEGSMGFLVEDNVINQTSGHPIRFNQNKKEWHTWRTNSFGEPEIDPRLQAMIKTMVGVQLPYRNQFPDMK